MKSCEYWPKGGKAEPVGVGDTALIWGGYYGAVGVAVSIKTFKQPVTIIPSSSVLEIKKDGEVVLVTSKFERSALKIDSVVFAGVQADDSLFQQYRAAGLVVATIGDVKRVRNLCGAVTDGANIGLTLDENLQINANAEIIASLPADIELQAGVVRAEGEIPLFALTEGVLKERR